MNSRWFFTYSIYTKEGLEFSTLALFYFGLTTLTYLSLISPKICSISVDSVVFPAFSEVWSPQEGNPLEGFDFENEHVLLCCNSEYVSILENPEKK